MKPVGGSHVLVISLFVVRSVDDVIVFCCAFTRLFTAVLLYMLELLEFQHIQYYRMYIHRHFDLLRTSRRNYHLHLLLLFEVHTKTERDYKKNIAFA